MVAATTARARWTAAWLTSTPTTRPAGPTISARTASPPRGPQPQSIVFHPCWKPTLRNAVRVASAPCSAMLKSRRRS
jgi:hypothetical protein